MKLNGWNLVILGILAAAIVAGCVGGGTQTPHQDEKPNDQTKTPAATPTPEIPTAIKAATLTREYADNELAADEKYSGKLLEVTGKLTNISVTLGSITAQIEGYRPLLTVMCSFSGEQKQKLAALKTGQQVTFVGTGNGMTAGLYVGLKNCSVK